MREVEEGEIAKKEVKERLQTSSVWFEEKLKREFKKVGLISRDDNGYPIGRVL